MSQYAIETLNSAGKPIHPTPQGIENFWRWFANSKVVDEYNRPLIAYHGTTAQEDFTEFFAISDFALLGKGIQFTSNPDDASKYASSDVMVNLDFGPKAEILSRKCSIPYVEAKAYLAGPARVIPVFLSMQNPLRIDAKKLSFEYKVFHLAAIEADIDEERIPRIWKLFNAAKDGTQQWEILSNSYATRIYRQAASILLKDGIILGPEIAPKSSGGCHFIVFQPEQIKSAIGNNGSFLKGDHHICGSIENTQTRIHVATIKHNKIGDV